eukprot:2848077-Pyramimonas_sp.AAC.1
MANPSWFTAPCFQLGFRPPLRACRASLPLVASASPLRKRTYSSALTVGFGTCSACGLFFSALQSGHPKGRDAPTPCWQWQAGAPPVPAAPWRPGCGRGRAPIPLRAPRARPGLPASTTR